MYTLFRFLLIGLFGILSITTHAADHSKDPIIGDWQTYDDTTGGKRAIVRISYNKKDNTFYGRIIKRNYVSKAGVRTQENCYKCPAPFTDKKVLGMVIIWSMKKHKTKSNRYENGYVIDPTRGHIYGLEFKMSKSGDSLRGRGYLLGLRGIGRRQTWLRVKQ